MKLKDLKKVIELEDLLHEIDENVGMVKSNRSLRISELNDPGFGIPIDAEIRTQVLKKLEAERERAVKELEGLGVEV